MKWSIGILSLTLVAPLGKTLGAQQVEVTLDEAVRRALLVQPAMVQATGATRSASAARRSSLGAFLPRVSVSGSASKNSLPRFDQNSQSVVPPIWNYGSGLSASVDLFTGLRRLWSLRAATANLDAAEAGSVNERFRVTREAKRAFYEAIETEELVRVAEAQRRRAEQQLQISIEKLRAGSATRSDSLRSSVDHGRARITLLQAQANLATAQANLGRQIGHEGPVRAVPDTVLPAFPDTAALRAVAAEDAPAVAQAEARARAARASVWSARSQFIPRLSVSYGDSRRDTLISNAFVNNASHTWSFSVGWTLFDGFAREEANATAQVQRQVTEAQAGDARRQVSADLTEQLAALATSYVQIDIAGANVAAATEDLRVQQERYRVGAATILDLLTSQASLTQAQVDLVRARFDYLRARAEVEAIVGRSL